MGKLGKWAYETSEWLRIADGETVTVTFLGFEIVKSSRDPDKELIRYALDVGGLKKSLESRSFYLAEQMDQIKEGTVITITRTGGGSATKYEVGVVGEKEPVKPEEVEVGEES